MALTSKCRSFLVLASLAMLLSACAHREPRIIGIDTPQMPLIRVGMLFPFGSANETAGHRGATAFSFDWLLASTSQLDRQLQRAGAITEIQVEPHFTLVSIEAPQEGFLEAWVSFTERLKNPTFNEEVFEQTKKKLIAAKRSRLFSPLSLFKQFSYSALYAGTSEANCFLGVESDVLSLDAAQVRALYQKTFGKGPAVIFIPSANVVTLKGEILERTKGWASGFAPPKQPISSVKESQILIVDRPGSRENYLIFVKASPSVHSLEYFYTMLATEILGGNGGNASLLGRALRQDRALTYHASLQTTRRVHKAMILGLTFGPNEKIADLATGYMDLWNKFLTKEVTDLNELLHARKLVEATAMRENETLSDIFRNAAEAYSISGEMNAPSGVRQIDVKQFNEAKSKWLSTTDLTLIAIGDRRILEDTLPRGLGSGAKVRVLPANSDWDAISDALSRRD